ncbi:MAG: TonB family protein [Rhodothermales bacterium]
MALKKTKKADLRRRYPILTEVGLIASLTLLIVAFKVRYNPDNQFIIPEQEQVVVQMEEIEQTQQIEKPPPPPRPPVPIEVPNDEVLEDEALDIDAEIDFDEPADLPPPPPPKAEEPEPEIFVVVENMPELIGGIQGLQKRVKYPEIAKKAGVEGTVFLQFVVDEKGNVVDPAVVKGIGAGCDEAALEAIKTAKFKPGKQRGKPVKVKFSLPVRFRLK